MARYNSVNSISSVAGGTSISTPYSGLLTTLTGSGTVNLPNPVLYAGSTQIFYNSTASAITLSTATGQITGPGVTAGTTLSLPASSILTLISDGSNYITQDWLGGVISATSGTINGISVGATTASTGAFTTLSASSTTTLAAGSASGVFSFTSVQASNATNNGAVVISGGLGVAGNIYTGAQLNVTAGGASITGVTGITGNTTITGTLSSTVSVTAPLVTSNGQLTANDTNAAANSSTRILNITNSPTSTNYISALANAGGGSYNAMTSAGDQLIVFSGGTQTSSGNLMIGPWTVNNIGIKIRNGGDHQVGGNWLPFTAGSGDLGSLAVPWRHVYTQDLNLSNGIGDYTIIEGEDNLYIVNNKSGKGFKFMLAEVPLNEIPPRRATT
jgi:hypothetical protein